MSQAEAARQAAEAAAQRQTSNARVRYGASRGHEPEGLRFAIELTQHCARLDARSAQHGIDMNAVHQRQVDHQPFVAGRLPREAVAPAAHRHEQIVRPGEVDGLDDVGSPRALGDHRRMAIEGAVPEVTRVVVARIARQKQRAAQAGAQIVTVLAADEALATLAANDRNLGARLCA